MSTNEQCACPTAEDFESWNKCLATFFPQGFIRMPKTYSTGGATDRDCGDQGR
ncbi:hypothetical protein EGR_04114 [Echinococcus granulosus]|uniref:Uncharacterized protein n=1 Tax=Echinococcus granulosus TaxID=6210 RepID=W6UIU4_ECHGR|nr:hypothetical protein EGR_04114 [Echinococcus granulosus]EUB61081.1 hypothetical protein EGR_04114 [Echinococcus granulosus]